MSGIKGKGFMKSEMYEGKLQVYVKTFKLNNHFCHAKTHNKLCIFTK
jgi:hypothetical protein